MLFRSLLRMLIDKDMIPDDTTVQVLTQSRKHIIKKTFESLKGTKCAIVHLYNSTSAAQREQVFKASKKDIISIAVQGAELIKYYAAKQPETDLSTVGKRDDFFNLCGEYVHAFDLYYIVGAPGDDVDARMKAIWALIRKCNSPTR